MLRNALLLGTIITLVNCDRANDISRVIIGAPVSLVHPHPEIKPTAATVEHQPGVPPGGGDPFGPTRPAHPPRPDVPNQSGNPFEWIVEWFSNLKASRTPELGNATTAGEVFLQELSDTQRLQLFELLNSTKYNGTSNDVQQFAASNRGLFDWLLQVTGFARPTPDIETTTPKVCPTCTCGESIKQIRIVGGVETLVNGYPWMAYLKYNGRFYCGASVISSQYVVTAAHCVSGFSRERLEVTLLDHDRATPFETHAVTAKVAAVVRHSRYNVGATYNNDIALVRLADELVFGRGGGGLAPVCLPTARRSFAGATGVAVGWGATEEHGAIANRLREVDVPIMANTACAHTGYGTRITENMLCAGYDDGKKDSCQGDSGGPLHVRNATAHEIVGIVSWGEGCAEPNYPGVYTRVNRYLTWIHANTKDSCYCS